MDLTCLNTKIPLFQEQVNVNCLALIWLSFELYLGDVASSLVIYEHFKAAMTQETTKKKEMEFLCCRVEESKDLPTWSLTPRFPLLPHTNMHYNIHKELLTHI
jgi:hypothetical protein